jgi:hypothetical protein
VGAFVRRHARHLRVSPYSRLRKEQEFIMRFWIVLVLIVACLVGVGFYRGWFHLTSDRSGDKSSITVTVDKDKMQQDKADGQKKVQDMNHR